MIRRKEYIGYKVEAGGNLEIPIYYMGFITYFDGEQIVVTQSEKFKEREDAWKWIGSELKKENE